MLNEKELEEIRRRLLELEEEPPVAGWQDIQRRIKPDNGPKHLLWIPLVLLLLLTGIGLITVHSLKQSKPAQVAAPKEQARKQENHLSGKQKNDIAPAMGTAKRPDSEDSPSAEQSPESHVARSNRFDTTPLPQRTQEPRAIALHIGRGTVKPTRRKDIAPVGIAAFKTGRKAKENQNKEKDTTDKTKQGASLSIVGGADSGPDLSPTLGADFSLRDSTDKSTPHPPLVAVQDTTEQPEPAVKNQQEYSLGQSGSWAVGLVLAPRYAFRKFTPNSQDDILITQMQDSKKLNSGRLGYELGVSVSKSVAKNLHLEIGLSMMQLRENVTYSYTTGMIDSTAVDMELAPDGSVRVNSSYLTEDRQLVSSYMYGGLRIGATYYFGHDSRRRFNLTAAGGANLLLKGTTKVYMDGEWTETVIFPTKENILEQSNYNLLLGIGYNVNLNRNFELTLMPNLNYFLGSTFKEREPFGLRPYSFGFNLQIKKHFSR